MATIPLFDGYLLQQRVLEMKRSARKFHGMVQQLVEDTHFEQRARLRAIRTTHPWDADRAVAVRQQADRAGQVILRMRQYRELCEEIAQLEALLPPRTGWHRVRYWNPRVVTWVTCGVSMAVSGAHVWLLLAERGLL